MVRVVFTPSGLEGEVPEGSTVLDAARQLGADLDSVCGGRGICGRCQIVPSTGNFPKWGMDVGDDALSGPNSTELDYAGKRPLLEGQRLGCATEICTDVVIDVPESSQIHKQVIRKDVDTSGITLDPVAELRYLELATVELGDDATATDLIKAGLTTDWNISDPVVDPGALSQLHAAIESDEDGLTVAVRDGNRVVAAWPGFTDRALGVAVDVGSTTIAGHLCDLTSGEVLATAGRMNPQIRFGEDLMSRVSYVMMNPGGEVELTNAVRTALDELIGELVGEARDEVLEIVLVGNPVMHHLLLGIDPTPLGAAPFLLATSDAVSVDAAQLDLNCSNARVYVAPCIAGHVGADTAAAVIAEGPHRSGKVQLLVDIGTNAEIVLGNDDRLFAASSPTGPAFEGAQISCGVRASTGAIERVRIDPETLEPRFKVIGSDLWSDEAGFDEAIADTGVIGICGSGIIEVLAEMSRVGLLDRNGVIPETLTNKLGEPTDRVIEDGRTFSYVLHRPTADANGAGELRIVQNDVRAIQLAKGALKAGIDLLMEHAGITEVDDVRLAGAFGSHIDTDMAVDIDLLPTSRESMTSPGNSAGTGAVRLLLSGAERAEVESIVRSITKIETATEPRFQELFVDAMAFPLAAESSAPSEGSGRRRRRRRSQ